MTHRLKIDHEQFALEIEDCEVSFDVTVFGLDGQQLTFCLSNAEAAEVRAFLYRQP